ncbi:membrane protein [Photobacterium aquae]|uniref:Membrane protein n=1 Tax=Photobacterium aquae TaxID=1195763 RepID=A0A0J1H0W1_9GAMM|nr:membrane protein [Photobacterium aquae]
MQIGLMVTEYVLVAVGLSMLGRGIYLYGHRTRDWSGIAKMFYQRVGMLAGEYRWYQLGVSVFVLGVVVRIVNLMLWPS